MKEFLKKYLSKEQIEELEKAYIADNPDSKGLPVYISKGRLDEVLGQKRTIEKNYEDLKSSIETQLNEAVQKAKAEAEAHEKQALEEVTKSYNINEAILQAKGKNIKAIKALIDPTKDVKEEIARLQKSDSYLFEDDIPEGTGAYMKAQKQKEKELEAMRAAVGV